MTEYNARLRAVVRSIGIITRCTSMAALGRKLLEEFSMNMGAEGGSLYLRTQENLVLTHTLDPGHAERSMPLPLSSTSVFGRVLERKMPLLIRDIQFEKGVTSSGWPKYKSGSLMAFPLLDNQGEILGMVTLHNKRYFPFTDQDREIGSILVSCSCEAIKTARAMKSLRESEEKYRRLVENMNDAVYSVDADGMITYVSQIMEKITGYAGSEALGLNFQSVFNAQEALKLEQNFNKCLRGKASGSEYPMNRKSGEPIWVRTSTQPIREGDRVVGLQGTLRDITASKKIEQRLETKAAELAVLNRLGKAMGADLSVESAIKTAIEHMYQAFEPDFSVLFLKEGDTFLPKSITPGSGVFSEKDVSVHWVVKCLCGKAIKERRAVYSADIDADPRCTHEECRMAGFRSFAALPLMSGSHMVGVLWMASCRESAFQGLSTFLEALSGEIAIGLKNAMLYEKAQGDAVELKNRLKKIEAFEEAKRSLAAKLRQTQKMEAIGTLAGGIAHDFNNILGGMIGYTELALARIPDRDEKLRGYLNKMLASCNRAKDLVGRSRYAAEKKHQTVYAPIDAQSRAVY